jgi:chondroitin-sulfate-ABC endolyase/exolyase
MPFKQMAQRLNFTRADLDRLAVERGQLDFSSRFVYEDDWSLRWQYQPGSTLTWNCQRDKLGKSPTFYFTALEPQSKGRTATTLRIEFLDASRKVVGQCDMPLVRPYWNRCIIQLVDNNGFKVGIQNFTGTIPSTVSAVRIASLAKTAGELFLGGWLLTGPTLLRRGDTAELDGFPSSNPPAAAGLPAPSVAETAAAVTLEQQLENGFMADWFNGIGKPFDAIMTEVMAHYRELNLRRTSDGMAGENLIMEQIRRSGETLNGNPSGVQDALAAYHNRVPLKNTLHAYGELCHPHGYCQLLLDVAHCYRRETDPGRKVALRNMYEMMFDYSQFLSGFPANWFSGEGYVESVFLMRRELLATRRLDGKLLELLRQQVKFDRIFLNHSVYSTAHPGDLGEDCDYTRLTSERLIYLALLEPDPKLRTHYLHAFQRWFSRIVLAYAPGVADTFKPDGSLNHHAGLQYGYGSGAMHTCARVIHLFARTPFAIEAQGHALFKEVLLKRRVFSRNGLDPLTLSGKEELRYANGLAAAPYLLMALAGTPAGREPLDRDMAAVYLRLAAETGNAAHPLHADAVKSFEKAKVIAEPVPQGHFTLAWSAAAVQRCADWLLLIKGHSRYAYSREAGHQPTYVTPYLGFGSMELLTPAAYTKRYSAYMHDSGFAAPGVDWTKVPGATTVFLPPEKLVWRGAWQHRSDQPFVGGVDAPDGAGIFVLSLHGPKKIGLDSFYARKSWFCFRDTVVCLGSDIRDDIAECETGTTLFQDYWRGANPKTGKTVTPLYLNNGDGVIQFPFEKQEQLAAPAWLVNRQAVGFYLYPGQQLHIRRSEQHAQPAGESKAVTGKFTTAWLSHGHAPKGAAYRYLMRINTTPDAMAAFAKSMLTDTSFKIHQQDAIAHIVSSKTDFATGYAIFQPNTALNVRPVISVSKPCVILARESAGRLNLSLADPDLNFIDGEKDSKQWGYSQPALLAIMLNGQWQLEERSPNVSAISPAPGKTLLRVECRDGLTTTINLISATPISKGP